MKSKGRLITIVAIVVGLLGGLKGFVLGGGAQAPAAGAEVTTTTHALGPVVTLDPITLNIAGGRFLKVGLAFQIAHDFVAKGSGHGGTDSDDPTKGYARAVDLAIEVLGGADFDTLISPEGRETTKEKLAHHLEEAYPGEIEDVYFTQFVMQ